jgi:repressor LexA
MSTLTPKQITVLNFIEHYIEENKYSPTLQAIADGLHYKSLATVHKHIINLTDKGFLHKKSNKAHSIEVMPQSFNDDRFTVWGPDRIWDALEKCYWVRENK